MGTRVLSPGEGEGVNLPGYDVNHSPSSTSAEIKNEWSYTSASPPCHCGMDREDFTYTFFVPY